MNSSPVQQESNPKCELSDTLNTNINSDSIVSCLDDNLNYTYAKSCKGGNFYFNNY